MKVRMVNILYRCGHEYRVDISWDTSAAQLAIMRMQAADTECPACRDPKSDEDYCDVHKRGNYERPQPRL